MVEIVEYSGLTICFAITGSIIIRNLWVYFDKNYNKQRHSLMVVLFLTLMSLVILQLRYALEFVYHSRQVQIGDGDDKLDSK